ncbi:hypothetical protein OBBRIDRAFT_883565 [Obba rivulosa]|uniref:Uncharacterized protein n=1 Tax=Obba rivulosa TaxID=1052685 RepID=A0A8E2J6U0_9APHY|nr:hypothetical protein OBBRIDRAFT_883565 [Obba rivulosa]
MLPRGRCLQLAFSPCAYRATSHRFKSTLAPKCIVHEADHHGIPIRPTWSVYELLSSYPQPTIHPTALKRLHELSGLIPPKEGTPEHAKLTEQMERLVKLVDAVKSVDFSKVEAVKSADTNKMEARSGDEGVLRTLPRFSPSPSSSSSDRALPAQLAPDGRIWAEGKGIELDRTVDASEDSASGQALLKHSSRVRDGFFVVDADRKRRV